MHFFFSAELSLAIWAPENALLISNKNPSHSTVIVAIVERKSKAKGIVHHGNNHQDVTLCIQTFTHSHAQQHTSSEETETNSDGRGKKKSAAYVDRGKGP
jgi:hypothetical protein